jgi:hypothetical protein
VLQLSAELDGQQYLSKQAFSVLTAAESAAKLGLRHAATFQPALVLPGAFAQCVQVLHPATAAWEAVRAAGCSRNSCTLQGCKVQISTAPLTTAPLFTMGSHCE